jgi:hypothetical protein
VRDTRDVFGVSTRTSEFGYRFGCLHILLSLIGLLTWAPFLVSHAMVTHQYAWNMVTHGTRYCKLNFVVIEQEMGEKFGVTRKGGLGQRGGPR